MNAVGDGVHVKETSVLIEAFPLVSGYKARLFLLAPQAARCGPMTQF